MIDLGKFKNFLNDYSSNKEESNRKIFSVYAICKNELENLDEWLKQFDKCDYICILDTGSKDGTYERLQELAKSDKRLIVSQKRYENFHYDEARNDAYELIPFCTDVCVTLDFDERLEPNWFDKAISKYDQYLTSNVYHIRRYIYKSNIFTKSHDYRLLFHPYLKDNREFMWCGYSGENLVYIYKDTPSLETLDENFVLYRTYYIDDVTCNHYIIEGDFDIAIKGLDGDKKCIEYFNDIHFLFQKEENFFKLVSYCHTRMIDYRSFIRILGKYKEITNKFLREDLLHLIDVIKRDRVDVSNLNGDLLSYIVDGILKQRGIYFGACPYVDTITDLLVKFSSNKERIKYSIDGIQEQLDNKFTLETNEWKNEL